jgi:AAA+ ATPase superfamily predicted ATPase
VALRDWEEALDLVAEAATRRRVGLVLDEFPYLCEAEPALPSLLQRWWDRTARDVTW